MKLLYLPVALFALCVAFNGARGDALNIATVHVGHPGNAPELSGVAAGGDGPNRYCGFVGYPYHISKFEITAGQYTEFLNAVAATDTRGLYNPAMWTELYGCRIQRSGSPGSYSYSVAPDWADRPVNLVSWGDAARFCNWLHNGQPVGSQNLSTTEDGSYFLNGATGDFALMVVTRKPDATWVIPTEDEWYKAAYHANDGPTGTYYDYPTASDVVPTNQLLTPDPGNSGNFFGADYTIGGPYYRTPVGAFTNSASPYGTFDQGGNVWEWNETAVYDSDRGLRGGSFSSFSNRLHAATRGFGIPVQESVGLGFRVANRDGADQVPAVSTWGAVVMALLLLTAATLALPRTVRRAQPATRPR